jgi:conserved oligomeric Golgi complex subunit 4
MAALVSGSNQALCSPIVGAVDESTTSRVDNLSSASAVESALDAALESASSVETKLEDLLSRAAASASARAAALTSVAQSATVLSDDASDLTTILESSATSAQALSARIRFLDKVLVSGTRALTRVDHVLTLRVCAEGAKTCLSAGDLGTAASHVHLYLSLDPDVRSDPSSLAAVAQMNQSIAELTRKVREKADAAVSLVADASVTADDHQKPSPIVTLMSVVKLFVPIGLPDEGIARFSAYLVAQIAADADRDASALLMDSAVAEKASGETLQQPHSVALAQLFETVASYVHVSEELVVQSFGSQAFVTLIVNLQQQCDLQSEKILARYAEIRRLDEVDRAVKAETTNPRDLDSLLSELSVISQRSNSYFEFLRLRCTYATKLGQTDADSTVEIEGELQLGCLNRALKSSRLAKWTSDLAARYDA